MDRMYECARKCKGVESCFDPCSMDAISGSLELTSAAFEDFVADRAFCELITDNEQDTEGCLEDFKGVTP